MRLNKYLDLFHINNNFAFIKVNYFLRVSKSIGNQIYSLAELLWPINRSITGNGLRETLRIIKKESHSRS